VTAPATPVLDSRRAADVLAELVEDVPGYSAHWRPRPGGSGYALLQVLSKSPWSVSQMKATAPRDSRWSITRRDRPLADP